jgi:pilus assembly protein CpaF
MRGSMSSNGFEVWRTFVPGLFELLEQDGVSEVQVNGHASVWVERSGVSSASSLELTEHGLKTACRLLAQRLTGEELGPDNPIVDTRTPNGTRVAIVVPPVSVDGYTLTLRKHQRKYMSLEVLESLGMFPHWLRVYFSDAVEGSKNILVSGIPGSGKTTLVDAMAHTIPMEERIVVIEDTTEIQLPHPNQRRFEAQLGRIEKDREVGKVTISDLVKASLRQSPKRLILGEIRREEAFDLLDVLNMGADGSIATIHASSAAGSLQRLTSCAMRARTDVPWRAVRAQIGDLIHVLVHLRRDGGARLVDEVLEVKGYDGDRNEFQFKEVYRA